MAMAPMAVPSRMSGIAKIVRSGPATPPCMGKSRTDSGARMSSMWRGGAPPGGAAPPRHTLPIEGRDVGKGQGQFPEMRDPHQLPALGVDTQDDRVTGAAHT